jgi:uracil-DNA glycosylase family 4
MEKRRAGLRRAQPERNGIQFVPLSADPSPVPDAEAPRDCPLCPRLVALREELRGRHPDWWNAPVPAFGDPEAWLGIVGLAPGLRGANRTGRPFTGDYAGDLLFATLGKFGLAKGSYQARIDDGVTLTGCLILNSVKCLPPGNKPLPAEVAHCRRYYEAALACPPNLRILIALGRIAHDNAVRVAGGRLADFRFAHLAEYRLPDGRVLIDSYHCSRYNQNTGRLTTPMFEAVFARALALRAS